MPLPCKIVSARGWLEPVPFRAPLKFGGRVVDSSELLNAEVIIETDDGTRGTGFGSMPVGNVWAWPAKIMEPEATADAMKSFFHAAISQADALADSGHPVDLMMTLMNQYDALAASIETAEPMPKLAQLVAASPVDAAVHDAYGKALGRSSFAVLSGEFMTRDLSVFLDANFAGEYLDRYASAKPVASMPLYHLVGALDPLTDADISERIDDGLPETLGEWILADGLTHLKIKLSGDDLSWDVDRVLRIEEVSATTQAQRACDAWYYSADFNEKCESVEYVLEFLAKVQEGSAAAFDRIQYIEQPTHRDLKSHPDNKMHRASAIKPVVIDESLTDYEMLLEAREHGYTGVALKTCKGQTESLLMAAAAQKFEMFLCVQDLTCPGASFLHSASLAAHIPTVRAIEGNARQYCPSPNAAWAERYPGMFQITSGRVETSVLDEPGLGYSR